MDAFTATHHFDSLVQEIHLLTQAYLGDPNRNALHLTAYLANQRDLLSDLQRNVFSRVPDAIFAAHWQNTIHLEEALLALERGYLRDRAPMPQNTAAGITDEMRDLVDLEYTGKEVAALYNCSTKTVYRKRVRLGIEKYARQHTTPDAVLKRVGAKFLFFPYETDLSCATEHLRLVGSLRSRTYRFENDSRLTEGKANPLYTPSSQADHQGDAAREQCRTPLQSYPASRLSRAFRELPVAHRRKPQANQLEVCYTRWHRRPQSPRHIRRRQRQQSKTFS